MLSGSRYHIQWHRPFLIAPLLLSGLFGVVMVWQWYALVHSVPVLMVVFAVLSVCFLLIAGSETIQMIRARVSVTASRSTIIFQLVVAYLLMLAFSAAFYYTMLQDPRLFLLL